VSSFNGAQVVVKLPYDRTNTNLEQIKIITSSDGTTWSAIDASQIIALKAQSELENGYIIFTTTHFSYYAVADSTVTGVVDSATTTDSTTDGGGGAAGLFMLLFGLLGLMAKGFSLRGRERCH